MNNPSRVVEVPANPPAASCSPRRHRAETGRSKVPHARPKLHPSGDRPPPPQALVESTDRARRQTIATEGAIAAVPRLATRTVRSFTLFGHVVERPSRRDRRATTGDRARRHNRTMYGPRMVQDDGGNEPAGSTPRFDVPGARSFMLVTGASTRKGNLADRRPPV